MSTSALYKKLKLVDDQEIGRLFEKYLREYDPALRVLANSHREMETILGRKDLSPEEKFSLFKSNQQRFSKLKVPPAEVPFGPTVGMNLPLAPAPAPAAAAPIPIPAADVLVPNAPAMNMPGPLTMANLLEAAAADAPPHHPVPLAVKQAPGTVDLAATAAHGSKFKAAHVSPPHTRGLSATRKNLATTLSALGAAKSEDADETFEDTTDTQASPFSKKYLPDVGTNATHVQKLNLITALIYKHPELITNDHRTGELVLEGKTLTGSSFSDILSSLYEKKGTQNLAGQKEFLKEVAKLLKVEGAKVKPDQLISKKELIAEVKGHLGTEQVGSGFRKRKLPFALHSNHTPPGKAIKVLYLYR